MTSFAGICSIAVLSVLGSFALLHRVEVAYRIVTSRTLPSLHRRATGKHKHIDIAAGERREICHIQGTGTIVRFRFTVPIIGQRWALKNLILRIFWDGENHASIEAPIGDFFGAVFG